jgi:hypothetical protein
MAKSSRPHTLIFIIITISSRLILLANGLANLALEVIIVANGLADFAAGVLILFLCLFGPSSRCQRSNEGLKE